METWRLLSFQRLSCFENMAIDEAVLRVSRLNGAVPSIRFYGWLRPSVTVGYFQKIDREINVSFCRERNIDIVRRPTGGKAVYHDRDVTYSVVASERNRKFPRNIIETYRIISNCLSKGLEKIGIQAELVAEGRGGRPFAGEAFCFSAPFKNELLVNGRKICGSAQMRGQGCFLQHGSILIDLDVEKASGAVIGGSDLVDSITRSVTALNRHAETPVAEEALVAALKQGFEEGLNVRLYEGELSPSERAMSDTLLKNKYSNERWTMKGRQ